MAGQNLKNYLQVILFFTLPRKWFFLSFQDDFDREKRSFAGLSGYFDGPLIVVDDFFTNGEPKTRSPKFTRDGGIRLGEGLKKFT